MSLQGSSQLLQLGFKICPLPRALPAANAPVPAAACGAGGAECVRESADLLAACGQQAGPTKLTKQHTWLPKLHDRPPQQHCPRQEASTRYPCPPSHHPPTCAEVETRRHRAAAGPPYQLLHLFSPLSILWHQPGPGKGAIHPAANVGRLHMHLPVVLHCWHEAARVDAPVPGRLAAEVNVHQLEGHLFLQQRQPGALGIWAQGVRM